MYSRLSAILFPIVTVVLIATGLWGYQEHQEKNAILIKAENQYQRAFHDLSFHMDSLHRELGHALAVNSASRDYMRKSLANVWRLTSEAQSEINQLPLTLLPFNKTEDFLSHISNFSYRASVRDLSKKPLSDSELKTLNTLYQRSQDIAGELNQVQTKVIQNHLRWMDVETALATEKNQLDNTIIDGFKTVDKKVTEYPELNWGPSVSSMYQKRTVKSLSGTDVSKQQVKSRAAEFLGLKSTEGLRVVENGKGTEYSSYSVSLDKGERSIQMDLTKKGGHLIWFMNNRPVKSQRLTIDQAAKSAKTFLKKHGYPQTKVISANDFDHAVNLTMAVVDNKVTLYPDKLIVTVALDNGEVTGLNASDFIFEHHKRNLPEPKLKLDQAKQKLNGKFVVKQSDLALIKNDSDEEVLCYQFTGRINGSVYRVYINAENGSEEKVETLETASD